MTSPSSFPSFIGAAIDKDAPKDADIPAHRRSVEQERKGKKADIVVVDGGVLIHALYQVKQCRDGRDDVIIVPLKGTSITTIIFIETHCFVCNAQYIGSVEERDVSSRSESSLSFSYSRGSGWH
jgi:hypothetical protein